LKENVNEIEMKPELFPNEIDLDETRHNIPHLLRTSHMNEEQSFEILKLISKYPEIIKRENDLLSSTGLLKHRIKTQHKNPYMLEITGTLMP
jgi:hypothetical protein